MSSQQATRTGIILAVIGALCFSTKAVFVKLAYRFEIDPVSLLLLRMGIALPFYIVTFLWSSGKSIEAGQKPTGQHWWLLVASAVLGYYLSSLLDFEGLKFIDASLERLILFIYPSLVAIMAHWWLGARVKGADWITIGITYIGLLLLFGEQLITLTWAPGFWNGVLLVLGCAFTFALYLILSQKLIPVFGVIRFTSLSMIIACLSVIAHYTIQHRGTFHLMHLPWEVWFIAAAMAFLATVIPSYLVNMAIARIGAAKAAIIASVGPLSTISLAHWLLGERLGVLQVFGGLCIVASITYLSWHSKRSARSRVS
ncbi:MAG: DMT family transporter [Saprospiraceae bacterium]|nr:DMT family transporter [Saprospiraceae bacterium]